MAGTVTAIYRCPSCENFLSYDNWSKENDICIMCLNEMEYYDGDSF